MAQKKLWIVSIRETGTGGTFYYTCVRAASHDEALERAIRKLWGSKAAWRPDSLPDHGRVDKSMALPRRKGPVGYRVMTRLAQLDIHSN